MPPDRNTEEYHSPPQALESIGGNWRRIVSFPPQPAATVQAERPPAAGIIMRLMLTERESVAQNFHDLTDDYLLEVYASGTLTPLALDVADEELTRRGIVHARAPAGAEDAALPAAEAPVILETVVRSLAISRLEILRARLEAEGIPAFVVDANTARAYSLIVPAMGGARLQVPREYAAEARALLAAIDSGALAATSRDVGDAK